MRKKIGMEIKKRADLGTKHYVSEIGFIFFGRIFYDKNSLLINVV